MKEQILKLLVDGHYSTKEIAIKLGIKTKQAYNVLIELEKENKIGCMGYLKLNKGMAIWEDRTDSTRHTTSLHWYVI